MPTNEKEIDNYLFDQLSIIEEAEEALETGDLEEIRKVLKRKRRQVERKLYKPSPENINH